ncbi:MAG TPA: glycosyltransferase family 1 protein [Gammaproteobacteria bacterium]|nr:glycosyltransferase family 1 protein [Gammaproteobacteria bacterium]
MKIGIMLRHAEQHHGGVLVYTHNLVREMLDLETPHEFVLLYQNPNLIGTYGDGHRAREIAFQAPSALLWDQLAVPWLERKERFDVIFNPKFTVPFLSKAKKVFVLHGSEWFVIPQAYLWYDRWYTHTLTSLYCRHADAVITVSNVVKQDIVKFTGVKPEKVVPVHNGFDPNRFQVIDDPKHLAEVRQTHHLPEQFILWTGQLYPPKNIGRLLEAFARVKDEIPHMLVIAGEERWRYKEDLALIERLGIKDRIHFTGWVSHDHLPAFYNLADLFVLPSLYEGFGIPLLEAMACGCPVLTATTGTPPEVVEDAGYLVDPIKVDEIAAGICEVLSNSELRSAMVAKGLERVKEFSWEKCARETLGVLERVGAPQLSWQGAA